MNSLDKFQNNVITKSLSPNRGGTLLGYNNNNNDLYFQGQTSRQRQPNHTTQSLIRPAEDFYFKDFSKSENNFGLREELEQKVSFERAKDNLELFSKALENNLKKAFPPHQAQEYVDRLDDLNTQLPIALEEINFKINELEKKTSLIKNQNTTLFERLTNTVNDDTLRI